MTAVRAAFHVHSEWSYDARLSLHELAVLFAAKGYDAVFMCEHDRGFTIERKRAYDAACADLAGAGAVLIPGIEYADVEDRVHVAVWGPVPFLGEGVPTDRVLQAALERGGVSVIAHPKRRQAWRIIEPAWLQLCTGLEVWTRKWDGWAPDPWAVQQAEDASLVGVVALDLHQRRQTFPLAMELEIAPPVSAHACLDALRDGRCRGLIRGFPITSLTGGRLAAPALAVERLRRPVFRHGRRVRDRLIAVRHGP